MTTYAFGEDFQRKILAMAFRDEVFLQSAVTLIESKYFDNDGHKWLIELVKGHYEKYRQAPTSPVIMNYVRTQRASKKLPDEIFDEVKVALKYTFGTPDLTNRDYTLEQVEKFAQEQALTEALLASHDLLEKGAAPADIQAVMNKAVQVGVTKSTSALDLSDFESRIEYRQSVEKEGKVLGAIPTGIKDLDAELRGGGMGRKEMFLFMGGPKSGKSIAMMNCAVNAAGLGYNVLFLSCENSSEITGDRMDTYISGVKTQDLLSKEAEVRKALSSWSKSAGKLKVHEFPTNTLRVSDIRRLLQKYQSEGIIFDLITVDYADIMSAERHYADKRFALEEIYAGLRALAQEENLALLTATQTNREGAKSNQAKGTDAAESIDKVRLTDILISINANDDEKANGEVRLYFAASRNTEDGFTLKFKCNFGLMRFAERLLDRY